MPAKGHPQLLDALCIMTSLLAALCCQVKAPQSAQPEKPEVPTTSEPFRGSVRVLAAVNNCDRTKEGMVDDIHCFLFSFPAVLSSPDIQPEPSDQSPAAQLQVSGDLTKMIAAFVTKGCP